MNKKFDFTNINKVLIRGTNWIGDVVMTLPAIAAVRRTFPEASISVLVKPWVADLMRICPDVDDVIVYERPGSHEGIGGLMRLARELREKRFDMAVLLQNAIEAAILAWLARIPIRAGYSTDGRGFLLTHAVKRSREVLQVHQTQYYLEMLKALGFDAADGGIHLRLGEEEQGVASGILARRGVADDVPLVGMAPGATYGPAKMWFADRFAAVADRLIDKYSASVLLFGSASDRDVARKVQQSARHPLTILAGETSLKEAVSLIARCRLFISNDSGLMHVAGALGVPTVAIFGSTNPRTTSPVGKKSVVITKGVPCSPCLKETCPTDFICMGLISADEVVNTAESLWDAGK